MDMEVEETRPPAFIGYFEVSNQSFAWREPRLQQIERRRAALGDLLIFDVLLFSGGIREPDTLYPPGDVESLVRLLDAIESSHYDTLKKECLVYFLLKWHQDGREEKFQIERSIPPQFTALADAYWYLDAGINVSRAVSILSDARLNRDYTSKILQAISLSPNPTSLIRKYVRTAKPLLTEPDDLNVYTLALCESSLLEAWQFQRTFNATDETRSRLLKKILEWCISPDPRLEPLTQLVALPLTQYEESLIHSYAIEPPPSLLPLSVAVLRDLVCVRLIQSGKYIEAIKIGRKFASSPFKESKSNAEDRKKMVQELYTALPLAERSVLDTEAQRFSQGQPTTDTFQSRIPITNGNKGAGDASQSWGDISPPHDQAHPSVNGHTPNKQTSFPVIYSPSAPTPEQSGATRGQPLLNDSLSIHVPILPIPSTTVTNGHNLTPRRSLPLSSVLPTGAGSLSSRPRQSLNHSPSHFLLGSSASILSPSSEPLFPQSHPRLPVGVALPTPTHEFSSAGRKPNAFYQPPPAKVNDVERLFAGQESVARKKDGHADPSVVNIEVGMEMQEDQLEHGIVESGHVDHADKPELEFSVFENQGHRDSDFDQDVVRPLPGEAKVPEKPGWKLPPGAFVMDEETEDQDEGEPISKSGPELRSRPSRTNGSATWNKVTKQNGRTKHLKDRDLGRSLPGSLMDEEDVEEDEEEDVVVPLRAPSPPRRPLRKGRSSTSFDLGDDGDGGDGVQTRRRSSRLSTTHSMVGPSPEPSPLKRSGGAATKVRKSAKAGMRKKR